MKRRDLLKGLVMVPALSMFGSVFDDDKDKHKGKPPKSIRFRLGSCASF